MTADARRAIAARFLPERHLYWYTRGKLAMDPLYDIVCARLRTDREPLLDVGCGVGLLLHCLRAAGHVAPYRGVDSDAAKLNWAQHAAEKGRLSAVQFSLCDLNQAFPAHHGSVALLDVLQYLDPRAQLEVLTHAAQRLSPAGVLIMRGGLDDGGWRAALTRAADRFGHAVRWMRSSFQRQLTPSELTSRMHALGLRAELQPAWGRTPFNNWLIVARLAG